MNTHTKIVHLKTKKPNYSTDLSPSYVPVCTCLILHTFREIDTNKNILFFPNHCTSVGKRVLLLLRHISANNNNNNNNNNTKSYLQENY